jgi:hypothetical protein
MRQRERNQQKQRKLKDKSLVRHQATDQRNELTDVNQLTMYSEIHPVHEVNTAIKQTLKETRDKDPRSAFSAIWDRARRDNPELFGKLEAADCEA